jgi:ribonuclease HII
MTYGKAKLGLKLDCIEEMLYGKGYQSVCGVDEVGRGPLAGPVVAAAVIVPPGVEIEGVADSKRISASRRGEVFEEIARLGLVCAVGVIDNTDIDRMNIHRASLMAMRKAVSDLAHLPDILLVDGNHTVPKLDLPQYAIVGGDGRCQAIAAASIVAKVTRDRIMERYSGLYPQFSFAQHKGYPTAAHLGELREHGPCEIHRRSFKPVAEALEQYALI